MKLGLAFYQMEDVVQISKDLLGKFLVTDLHGEGITSGMIVETEAYAGPTDKASHAWNNRKTSRTQVMYEDGGISYVYLIYGFYYLFNIITNTGGIPHAVLIRGIEPAEGLDTMMKRRKLDKLGPRLTAGPGVLTQAMGITKAENGLSLLDDQVWVEDRGIRIAEDDIVASPRVGIAYAEEDALLPWRFRIKNNPWTSPAK